MCKLALTALFTLTCSCRVAWSQHFGPFGPFDLADDLIAVLTFPPATVLVWPYYNFQDGIAFDDDGSTPAGSVPDEYRYKDTQPTPRATAKSRPTHVNQDGNPVDLPTMQIQSVVSALLETITCILQ